MDSSVDRLTSALADRYAIERELGVGGMATVYLAEDLKHHRKVALKVLHPHLAEALGSERFLREIEVAARLRHPHILPLYDSGQAGGPAGELLYYVMPYAAGETLRARIARERQLPIDDALRIAREVADALSYAHSQGVVHRDIKPDNILLEAGHAVVADFGIAKALHAAAEDTALTATGMSLGTPLYMSPEQAAGDGDVDGRSDLYSLACVLYEMLAGQPPFTGTNAQALVRQHLITPAPPVTQFRPAVPAAVADALARALAKNPADRFNPVGQFATALVDTPLHPEPPSRRAAEQPTSAPSRPPRRAGILAAGALVLVLLGIAGFFLLRSGAAETGASIAVLPFVPAAGDTAANALALGVHGELVTELTRIQGLRVASRGSVLEYRGSGKSQRAIAEELGVATILTGDVQRAGDQVRVTMSLSDPVRGNELWAERYDRQLTTANLFAMQADVARAVAGALRLRLAAADTAGRPPTSSVAALELFYRAQQQWEDRAGDVSDSMAVDLAERAVALDPAFVGAWRLLTYLRAWRIRNGAVVDTLDARGALDRTVALAPGSLDARLAEGYYRYYAKGDFTGALAAMDDAARQLPGSSELMTVRALLQRRLGRWDEALTLQRQAVAADPRSIFALSTLTETLLLMRRYDDVDEAVEQHLAVSPTSPFAINQRLVVLFDGRGDTASARAVFDETRPLLPLFTVSLGAHHLAYHTRDLAAMRAAPVATVQDQAFFSNRYHRHLYHAILARREGDLAHAAAHADSLRAHARRDLARRGNAADPFGSRELAEMNIALADAVSGDPAAAVGRAEEMVRRLPLSRDAVEGTSMLRWLAMTYALAGRDEDAIRTLQTLLRIPSDIGYGALRLDPVWDDLRGNPAFEALLR